MTRNVYINIVLISTISLLTNSIDAKLTEDNFSDIRATDNPSFQADAQARQARIIEEMCNGNNHANPTPQAILNFINTIQIYINKIKDNQNITPETVGIARIAVIDVAKARKMLSLRTEADILIDIEHAINHVDRQVIVLEKYLSDQSK